MNKLLIATAAVAFATVGTAGAADLPMKAPPMAPPPAPTWTGCYISGGIGYGMWNQDHQESFLNGTTDSHNQTDGGRGWLGRAGIGCDYQAGAQFVIGAFADYDWESIKGDHELSLSTFPYVGSEKLSRSWAAGGRVGYLPYSNLLTFVSAGWTQAHFDGYTEALNFGNTPPILGVNATTYNGWFIGGGTEYRLPWWQNLTWKTEYRFSDFRSQTNTIFTLATGAPFELTNSQKWVQTVTTSLVWRFNWGGAVAPY